MKPMLLAAALGVLLAATPVAHAQQAARAPDPSDANAAVPPPTYESAMTGYARAPQDSATSPDQTWRQMNDALAAGSPHAAHGAAQASPTPHVHVPAAAPDKRAAPDKPAPAPAHAGHRHH